MRDEELNELKPLITDLNTAMATFKRRNDERWDQITDRVTNLEAATQQHANERARFGDAGGAPFTQPGARPEALKAFQDYLRGGDPAKMMEFARPVAGATTMVGPNVGFLVPQEIADGIEKLQRDFSPLRRLARVYRTKTDLVEFLIKDRSATSGWVGEQQARPETDGDKLDKVAIALGELYANIPLSQRMLDDSPDLASEFVSGTIADQFNQQEGVSFVSGNGVNKGRGFLSYPTALTADATRPFGTIQYRKTGAAGAFVAAPNGGDVLVNVVADLRGPYRQGSSVAWLMNSATLAQVRLLKDSQGRPLFVAGLVEGEPDRLLGFPVEIDENMPAIANQSYSIALANWQRAFVIAEHEVGTRILRDPFTVKPNVSFYATRRVSCAVLNSEAIKLVRFEV